MFSGAGSLKGLKVGGSFNASLDEANASGTMPIYKTGGRVKSTGYAIVHKNEYILPKGVKPTAEQKKQVREIKCKCKK